MGVSVDPETFTVQRMMDYLTSPYTEDFEENYVDPVTTPHPTNIAKYFQLMIDGYWSGVEEGIVFLREQSHVPTMTGANLDEWAKVVNVVRRIGEGDPQMRARIANAIQLLYGHTTINGIKEFLAAVLKTSASEITIVENDPQNDANFPTGYRPAYFVVKFDLTLITRQGVPSNKVAEFIEDLDKTLKDISAAGVLGEFFVEGAATYDSGDTWDNPDTFWGT